MQCVFSVKLALIFVSVSELFDQNQFMFKNNRFNLYFNFMSGLACGLGLR